ncbi:hypothetical protein [Alkalihalobacillus sp. LMS39]|uniref:hypothetical protein n=1 Tax=Alkalihalobacillus sp. LMS39 TaxID=2924032 RepID=UPI001FB38CA2|nr:hypothetical protein [Alkalihalobacillus sp. LMS39]UOE96224.1 hypothetical protein MM271_11735 [Alkalihalobacillus sp. LMS39]
MSFTNPFATTYDPFEQMKNPAKLEQVEGGANPFFSQQTEGVLPKPTISDPFRDVNGNGIPDALDPSIIDINGNGISDQVDPFLTKDDIINTITGS